MLDPMTLLSNVTSDIMKLLSELPLDVKLFAGGKLSLENWRKGKVDAGRNDVKRGMCFSFL